MTKRERKYHKRRALMKLSIRNYIELSDFFVLAAGMRSDTLSVDGLIPISDLYKSKPPQGPASSANVP